MKSVKRISFCLIIISCSIFFFIKGYEQYDIVVQNKIIDNPFSIKSIDGYIFIPKFNIKRIIKRGTDSDILDFNYVGIHDLSGELNGSNLIILAGHNIDNVFGRLHDILIGDVVFINGDGYDRKFIVYDKKIVSEYDFSYFKNRNNELVLITCDKKGYRLLVFLKEDL